MADRRLVLTLAVAALAVLLGLAGVWFWLKAKGPGSFDVPAVLTTVAGDGAKGFADGPRARFSDPFALAIDAKGTLYVSDAGDNNRIRKIAPDGVTTTLAGGFDTPSGLAVDAKGIVYVADTGANLIRRIGPDGTVTTLAGDGMAGFRDGPAAQARFNGPIGVAVDKAGDVYVADTYNDRIRLITRDGQVTTLAGGEAPGFADGAGAAAAFHTPSGLALAPDGTLLVADTGNDAIRQVTQDGEVTTLARAGAGPLRQPVGLAVTRRGYIYVTTYRQGRILELAPEGVVRVIAGRDAAAPENRAIELARPAGVAVDHKGALYVAESAGYAIRKLTPHRGREAPPAPAALAYVPPAILEAPIVPWPLAPQDGWHEVVGVVGEARGGGDADSRLHGGLDVSAPPGTLVLAIQDEKVASPLAAFAPGGRSEGLQVDEVTYIHVRVGRTHTGEPLDADRFQFLRDPEGRLAQVRIKRGTRFKRGDALGTINPQSHVHLELGGRGGDANPMGLKLPGLVDTVAPRIAGIELLDPAGGPLREREGGRVLVARGGGPYSIVVDAWDQLDGNASHRRLGLYRAGYQVLSPDGAPVKGFEQPLITIEFDRLPADRAMGALAYALGSGVAATGASRTRFLYTVSNQLRGGAAEGAGWNPADLPPGDYILRIHAADYAGNVALEGRDLPIRVR